jgi:hypothetical protein
MGSGFSKLIASAASAGLLLGAVAACDSSKQGGKGAKSPSAAQGKKTAKADKDCCKGLNECRGKGNCKTSGHACAGMNECRGKGGCNAHCPK